MSLETGIRAYINELKKTDYRKNPWLIAYAVVERLEAILAEGEMSSESDLEDMFKGDGND